MEIRCLYRERGGSADWHREHVSGDQFELIQVYCTKGKVLAGSKMYPMVNGAVYLINSSKPHCTLPEDPDSYVRSIIVINTAQLREFLHSAQVLDAVLEAFEDGGMCHLLNESARKEAEACFQRAQENISPDNVLLEILKLIHIIKNTKSDTVAYDRGIIGNALNYIDENFLTDLSTADIAKHLHISRYHLCHVFKQNCGITISDYILGKRLSAAKKRLLETENSVTEVSDLCGFSCVSYFISVFGKHYGCTPKKFRENQRGQ